MDDFSLEGFNFDALARAETNGRLRVRYLALAHLKDGTSLTETARMLRTTRKAVSEWHKRFLELGLEGLREKERLGRPFELPKEHHQTLKEEINKANAERSGGSLTGADIIDLIEEKWQVTYSLSGVYELLKKINMSWISARSKHPKQDIHAQEYFKKTSLSVSIKHFH